MIQYRVAAAVMLCVLLLCGGGLGCMADPPENPGDDFVKSSIVVADPGEALYSGAGHIFFRMQCPDHGMDFCFSYESEAIEHRVLTFLAGRLKMGMAVARTPEFLSSYAEEHRGVREYPLNLPIAVKQNLWRVLDNHVDEGMDRPYDYLEHGCAVTVLHILEEAIGESNLKYAIRPADLGMSRRMILSSELDNAPWSRFAIHLIMNGAANDEVPYKEKCVTPRALISLLQSASYEGKPVLGDSPDTLVAPGKPIEAPLCTPVAVAVVILLLSAICAIAGKNWMLYALLAVQSAIGIINVYLVVFSSLCGTEWSWLLIPFNPLPLIFWKWRRHWEPVFTIIVVCWAIAMTVTGAELTDPAFILLAVAIAVTYMGDMAAHPESIPLLQIFRISYNSSKPKPKPIRV